MITTRSKSRGILKMLNHEFLSDVNVGFGLMHQQHSKSNTLNIQHGKLLSVKLSRPYRYEEENEFFILKNKSDRTNLALTFTMKNRSPVQVFAHTSKMAFDRGTFYVAAETAKWFKFEKTRPTGDIYKKTYYSNMGAVLTHLTHSNDILVKAPKQKEEEVKSVVPINLETAPAMVVPPPPELAVFHLPPTITTKYTNSANHHSLPTAYKNIKFRSMLEANFARFLDACCIEWTYEKLDSRCHFPKNTIINRCNAPQTYYTPDFYLVQQDVYIELKPPGPSDEAHIRCGLFSKYKQRPIILMSGDTLKRLPFEHEDRHRKISGMSKPSFKGIVYNDGVMDGGHAVFVYGQPPIENVVENLLTNYDCIHIGQMKDHYNDTRWEHPSIINAMENFYEWKSKDAILANQTPQLKNNGDKEM